MIYDTAGAVINFAATESGLTAVADPYASSDPAFIQLCTLLTSAGRELLGLHEWQRLTKRHSILTTVAAEYPLPADFGYMIDQTHWNHTAGQPMGGPISAQDWTYITGSSVGVSPMYVSFRVAEGIMKLLPDPMTAGQDITFEYVTRNWVLDTDGVTGKSAPTSKDDVVLYESMLITKFLKLRFLEAKGFDTTAAMNQFTSVFTQWTGRDIGAPVLNMARSRLFPYLGWRNVPETNYGLS